MAEGQAKRLVRRMEGRQVMSETKAHLQNVMKALEDIIPGCAIVLLVAPFNAPEGARVNYISNGKRETMLVLLKEFVARAEGRAHDAPERKQ
jgi:hypothetical protein